ncbi:hypothetical protein [Janibacter limosus]|uniref:hypothetical protein n=1 Tax=Janibacter limosus TaxID=53458 RepID=UPI000833E32C|nr:hypothetical protein [Janibacter limosus]
MRPLVLAAAAAVSLTACGIAPETPAPSSTFAADISGTSTTTSTSSSTPDAYGSNDSYAVLTYTCGGTTFETAFDARESGEDCEAESNGVADISSEEMAALDTAYGDEETHEISSLDVLWGLCATNIDPATTYPSGLSSVQTKEIKGMLTLCPDHPRANEYRTAMKKGQAQDKERAEGTRFNDGTFVVGTDVKPGTYVVKDVEDCYWERQDANGATIDNDFKTAAAQIRVTIASTDHAFVAKGCGEWTQEK